MPDSTEEQEELHHLDLPPLYTKPDPTTILSILSSLHQTPTSFGSPSRPLITSPGISSYLTSMISSPLSWISSDDIKEQIWELASKRLAERAGRNAAPSVTRTFTLAGSKNVLIHEPSLTGDNLGHKTWGSSYALSLLLPGLADRIPRTHDGLKVLELGAGTGLLGIAFGITFPGNRIDLTDLPEIVENLQKNIELNINLLGQSRSVVQARELDWTSCPPLPLSSIPAPTPSGAKYNIVLAADPIYSPSHPELLTRAVYNNLSRTAEARFLLGLPIREAYLPQIEELWSLLSSIGLEVLKGGEEDCTDDWIGRDGEAVKIRVRWAVWKWKNVEREVE